MDDSVARDAKRLLLRYGAPISVVERLDDEQRISVARVIVKSAVADRQATLKKVLYEKGWMEKKR